MSSHTLRVGPLAPKDPAIDAHHMSFFLHKPEIEPSDPKNIKDNLNENKKENQIMKKTFRVVMQGLAVSMLFACGASSTSQQVETSDIPKWVLAPPAACGVGISKVRSNLGMAMKTSEARGRDALARQLKTRVQGMIKDYQQSGEAEAKDFTEELTTNVSRQLVDTTLIGTSTRMQHVGKDDPQQFFALVCLQPDAFIGAFEKMSELNGRQREALKRRAALEFRDLDKQLKKYQD